MIFDILHSHARVQPTKPFLIGPGVNYTYSAACQGAISVAEHLIKRSFRRVASYCLGDAESILLLLASDISGAAVCNLNANDSPERIARLRARYDLVNLAVTSKDKELGDGQFLIQDWLPPSTHAMSSTDFATSSNSATCLVLTTGTTGEPKGAVYRWPDLVAQVKQQHHYSDSRWLLAFNLNHFAGLQVLLHVLVNGATLVLPQSRRPHEVFVAIKEYSVDSISATPTFWRIFMAAIDRNSTRPLPIRQVTAGGEPVTAETLSALRDHFPQARVSQVYATTELGSCFSVRDGEKGFPVSLLKSPHDGIELKIENGELLVRALHGMTGYYGTAATSHGEWHHTGDLVRIEGERVLFLGRKSEVINVGGVKIHPLEIEEAIRTLPEIVDVRVYGRSNPVTGNIVVADVVPREGIANLEQLAEHVRAHCAKRLDSYREPRLVRIVESLHTSNLKLVRSSEGLADNA